MAFATLLEHALPAATRITIARLAHLFIVCSENAEIVGSIATAPLEICVALDYARPVVCLTAIVIQAFVLALIVLSVATTKIVMVKMPSAMWDLARVVVYMIPTAPLVALPVIQRLGHV